MVSAHKKLENDLKGFTKDPCEEEAKKCGENTQNLVKEWRKTKANFQVAAATLKEIAKEGDVIRSTEVAIEFAKLTGAVFVELCAAMSMLKKNVELVQEEKTLNKLKSILKKALQQLKEEAHALKRMARSEPEAVRILVEARKHLELDCKAFVECPGEETWKACTDGLRTLLDSWVIVKSEIMIAVEEVREKARDKDTVGGKTSAVVFSQLLRGAVLELLQLTKVLGEIKQQVTGMEVGMKAMAEAALEAFRGELKAMHAALTNTSTEQLLNHSLRAEAELVKEKDALLDYAEMKVDKLGTFLGAPMRGAIGAARNVNKVASDALEMTESVIEIASKMRYMKQLANRVDEETKKDLEFEMSKLSEVVAEIKEAIETFGKRGYFGNMFKATKMVRRLADIERKKEVTLKAMDRVIQQVETDLQLDNRDRVQLAGHEGAHVPARGGGLEQG
jgi:hypothetical protein